VPRHGEEDVRRSVSSSVVMAVALAASLAMAGASPGQDPVDGGQWRAARWGMTVQEVLAAFPGEATRIDPEEKLADGNVVAAGIEGAELGGEKFRVRFVFTSGRLSLVSLSTPRGTHAPPEVFRRVEQHLADALGDPSTRHGERELVDLRQTRWIRADGVIDVKFMPGVVVVLYHALPRGEPPPLLRRDSPGQPR
jgi:hypothetical protein